MDFAILVERPDVPVNFQGSVEHYQLKTGARLGVGFHLRLHEHRSPDLRIQIMTHCPEADELVVVDRDMQVKVGPGVGVGRSRTVSSLIAPRERDLWELPRDGPALAAYCQLRQAPIEERQLRLYRAWYDLAETAVYISLFRSPHVADQNSATAWDNFRFFLPTREHWPDVVT